MDFLIQENFAIATPKVGRAVTESLNEGNSKKRLIVEVSAIHEGVTRNYNKYTSDALRESTLSWMAPYPKPLILNHDLDSDPIGRMVNADYKQNNEGRGYIALKIAVLDSESITRVLDGRYLTGSVGGVPQAVICSICSQDIIARSKEGESCGHSRGATYEGQTCVYEHRGISFHEYSFVNAPGDTNSLIQTKALEAYDLNVYSYDLTSLEVKKFDQSEGFINLQESMSLEEANILRSDIVAGSKYLEEQTLQENELNITFLKNSSTIVKESEFSDREQNEMDENKVTESQEDEDILDVTDRLSENLASEDSVEIKEDETTLEDKKIVSETEESEDTEVVEDKAISEEAPKDKVETENEYTKEYSSEELSLKENDKDLESSDESEVTEASEDNSDETEAKLEEQDSEEVTEAKETVSSEEATDEVVPEDGDSVAELQELVNSLKEENEKLKEQNGRMKAAIHAELAEKVVDARIAVGHIALEEREAEIESHKARSASSLGDALVDIRKFAENNNFQVNIVDGTVPSLDIQAVATESKAEPSDIEDEGDIVETQESVDPQELLIERFSSLLSKGTEKFLSQK